MFGISVKGGTGAGRKRPLKAAAIPWACGCKVDESLVRYRNVKINPGYLARCIDCGAHRPDARG